MAASVVMTLVGIVAAASSKILADEFKAWRPRLTRELVALAVRRLPGEQRERYSEEWLSHVEEVPGEVGKVLASIGLLWAGVRLRSILRKKSKISKAADSPIGK